MNGEDRCVGCNKVLSRKEVARYYRELEEWARKHPEAYSQHDDRDESLLGYASGVWMDCDRCAVERLRGQKEMLASKTFMERVADGGPEGFWLIAVVILVILVFCFGR